ncbi:MAG: DUF6365 family protein [Lachnospiraceae bacterium]|nr:DUF6365 family protein [Lachnospiraceae bacterium]
MTILFIVTSFWAYGELVIACEFAKRLHHSTYNILFLIPPSHEKLVKNFKFSYITLVPRQAKINKIILKDIEHRLKPQIIILADFLNYHFCTEHYGLMADDLEIFTGKIGTFDNFDWQLTREYVDTYGFKAWKFADVDVSKYSFRLCPCPILAPRKSNNNIYYQLITNKLPYDMIQTNYWKNKLGLPNDKKMILFTHATWQETYKAYPHVTAFIEANGKAFEFIIKELAKKYCIICVGATGKYSNMENPNIYFYKQLSPTLFDRYLLATDLLIARNITSTSLAKAVVSGIPAINFINSISFNKNKMFDKNNLSFEPIKMVSDLLESLDRCYPYRMFPVGWHKFLSPLLKSNPYNDIIINLEQFDIIGSLTKINYILSDDHNKLNDKVAFYNNSLNLLPKANEIIESLMKRKL